MGISTTITARFYTTIGHLITLVLIFSTVQLNIDKSDAEKSNAKAISLVNHKLFIIICIYL